MNILAHAYLTEGREEISIGNFIADFIKGDPAHPRHGLSVGIQQGVRLHRAIDRFTDVHPVVEQLKQLVRPRCHKYAGPAIDMFLDHFVAIRFEAISGRPLAQFVAEFYGLLQRNRARLPADARRMAEYMINHDWLNGYARLEGIDRALKGMARRTTFPSNLETAIDELTAHYPAFSDGFDRFFPELAAHVEAVSRSMDPRWL